MIINSSMVDMAASTVRRESYKEENTGLMFSVGGDNATNKTGSVSRVSENNLVIQLRQYLYNFRNRLTLMIGRSFNNTMDLSKGISGASVWHRIEKNTYTYEEQQSMTFQTVGKAVTADGRTIDFDMQLFMSREYTESVERLSDTTVILTDPLVINLNDSPVSVADEKWSFDIDADGGMESISRLSEGSGYLVLDKNGDGIINDGGEMFGAKTGNGFKELAKYDDDGNGWIDEGDKVYRDLAVWIKDDAGNDRIVSLKSANVGAIYLGSVNSEYSLKSDKDNSYNAEIRRSGVYLTEDGRAKSIQQLDMVNALIS